MRIVRAALLLLVSAVSPVALAAPCGGFVDVDDSNPAHAPFCDSVEWMKNRAITFGLTPTLYDPNSFVTRLQMAAFMYRLGFQNSFLQGGNAFGTTAILGTTDNRPLEILVNNSRAILVTPGSSPNIVGGASANDAQVTCAGICIPTPSPVRGATIGGGGDDAPLENRVTDSYGTVGGGSGNRAGDDDAAHTSAGWATVSGGSDNIASGQSSAIAGGSDNIASGGRSAIGGGSGNIASGGQSTVAGGTLNHASGSYATVAGGSDNEAGGQYSFAAGHRAKALGRGSFAFADDSGHDFSSTQVNRFRVRATGGVTFVTDIDGSGNAIWVCVTGAGSGWACASDMNQKQNLRQLDGQEVLERLVAMPVFAWNPRGQNAHVNHYGPTAQDFHAAFGLGDDDKLIGSQDADGVALAAIQGLNTKHEAERAARNAEIASLRAELAEIRSLLASRTSHSDSVSR